MGSEGDDNLVMFCPKCKKVICYGSWKPLISGQEIQCEHCEREFVITLTPKNRAAQQSMHLTDGALRDLVNNLTPKQLSALITLLTPPTGR